jgi:SNF2 family DNA or RNA helicase
MTNDVVAFRHIHEGQIRTEIFHGSGRESHANQFRDADVVITTYETLRFEWAASKGTRPLYSWKWLRVVLDEGKQSLMHSGTFLLLINPTAAHHIRNRSKQAFQSVCELTSRYRWCLTGTPIHNSLDDYGALLSFIRVFPFVNKSNFMSWIVKPVEEKHKLGIERLQGLIRATCLRRTKQKTLSSNKLNLPPRSEKIHEVHLHRDDQVLYDTVRRFSAEVAAGLEKRPEKYSLPKGKEKNILVLINSLRLICDHGEQLLPEAVKRRMEESSIDSFASEMQQVYHGRCFVCEGELDDSIAQADGQDSICANCATSEQGASNTNLQASFLGRRGLSASQSASSESSGSAKLCYRPSAKVLALLGNLEQERTAVGANRIPRKRHVITPSLLEKITSS